MKVSLASIDHNELRDIVVSVHDGKFIMKAAMK